MEPTSTPRSRTDPRSHARSSSTIKAGCGQGEGSSRARATLGRRSRRLRRRNGSGSGTEQLAAERLAALLMPPKETAPSEALISSELDVIKAKEAAQQAQIEALGRDAAAAATKAKAESEAVKAEAALAKEAARRELKLAKAEAAQEAAKKGAVGGARKRSGGGPRQ